MAQRRMLLFVFVVVLTAGRRAVPQELPAPQPGPIWYAAFSSR
jgi:hypothetical protein